MSRFISSQAILIAFSLVFVSCAQTVASSVVISNEAVDVRRIPTLANNLAAYVSVYCFWRSPIDGETIWDTMPGVILDQTHVLTTLCDEVSEMVGWEHARMDSLTVGPLDAANESGHGPWPAREVTKNSPYSDLVIVATNAPMPLPNIVPTAKNPGIGDVLYTVTLDGDGEKIITVELFVVSALGDDPPGSSEVDFSVLMPDAKPCCYVSPTSVFNNRHEFVGFVVGGYSTLVIPTKAPKKFQNGKPYGIGYDIAATGSMLKTLMRQAGVSWPN